MFNRRANINHVNSGMSNSLLTLGTNTIPPNNKSIVTSNEYIPPTLFDKQE